MKLRARFDPETSHQLERLAARGWPADEVHEVEGWLLRRTVGVDRRRSNSMLPPADPAHAARTVDLAIATAEELDVAPVVQVSPAEGHLRLDDALAARGMQPSGASLVLAGPNSAPARRGRQGRRPAGPPSRHSGATDHASVRLQALDRDWVDAWHAVSSTSDAVATAELVLGQLGEHARFAVLHDEDGAAQAVGIGVVEEGWLGIFSLATAPSLRRRGLGSAIVDALEDWAATLGADRVYLQVERDNAVALRFYARRGFYVAHSYHYRSA
ncbi:MAG: arginase/agmatinase/formimionoglutamate hydrolase arginase family-like protein [Conexibacter sp.]|nr:arginase/agmatinase/formimionoglutamate hydrolase arginase family-like protein [Conexibacter sp.]